MRVPKNCSVRLDTDSELAELHVTAAITTKAQAKELAACIRQFEGLLEGEKRVRKPKLVGGTAAASA